MMVLEAPVVTSFIPVWEYTSSNPSQSIEFAPSFCPGRSSFNRCQCQLKFNEELTTVLNNAEGQKTSLRYSQILIITRYFDDL